MFELYAGRERLRRLRGRKNAYLARRMRDLPVADVETLERAAEILETLLEDILELDPVCVYQNISVPSMIYSAVLLYPEIDSILGISCVSV